MSEEKLINKVWLTYLDKVVPKSAGSNQIMETKRAFFAGGHACYNLILELITQEDETKAEKDMLLLEAELIAFSKMPY